MLLTDAPHPHALDEICVSAYSNGIKALVQSLFGNLTLGQNHAFAMKRKKPLLVVPTLGLKVILVSFCSG